MRNRLIALCMIAAAALSSRAYAACPSGWLDIDELPQPDGLALSATNTSRVPITFTMDVDIQKLTASRKTTFTESLEPGESRSVIELMRSHADRKGRFWYETWCTIGNKDADHNDDVIYLMPYESSKSYRVLQGYGSRFSHTGRETYSVDFKMREGTAVHAARAGLVATVEESHSRGCWEDGCGRYANYIVVVHDDQTTGEYYHLQKNGALVEPGDYVAAGQFIGRSGNTGHTTMPHLHFGVYRADEWGREQSIPVRFLTADGVLDRPRSGGRYFAAPPSRVSRNDGVQASEINQVLK